MMQNASVTWGSHKKWSHRGKFSADIFFTIQKFLSSVVKSLTVLALIHISLSIKIRLPTEVYVYKELHANYEEDKENQMPD